MTQLAVLSDGTFVALLEAAPDAMVCIAADGRTILLVEDNPDDEALTLRAFKKSNSYRNGANAYVRKPVNFSDFAEAVRALGVFWLLLNEPAPSRGSESD